MSSSEGFNKEVTGEGRKEGREKRMSSEERRRRMGGGLR